MRFYVAGKANRDEISVTRFIEEMESRGAVCALDWTNVSVIKPHVDEHAPMAQAMVDAIKSCTVLFLFFSDGVVGALVEAGIALASGVKVFIIGHHKPSIFWTLPQVGHFLTSDEFFETFDSHISQIPS